MALFVAWSAVQVVVYLLGMRNQKRREEREAAAGGGVDDKAEEDWLSTSRLFHFGPSSDTVSVDIFGFKIYTWWALATAVAFLSVTTGVSQLVTDVYHPWMGNNVWRQDFNKVDTPKALILLYNVIYNVIEFLVDNLSFILTVFNRQLQFMLPDFIIRTVVELFSIWRRIKCRTFDPTEMFETPGVK